MFEQDCIDRKVWKRYMTTRIGKRRPDERTALPTPLPSSFRTVFFTHTGGTSPPRFTCDGRKLRANDPKYHQGLVGMVYGQDYDGI